MEFNKPSQGIYKTYNQLIRNLYLHDMCKDVKLFIKCYHKCQIYKLQPLNKFTVYLATLSGLPFTGVGLDIVGPLYTTSNGNKYIIVLVDYLTKWVEAVKIFISTLLLFNLLAN